MPNEKYKFIFLDQNIYGFLSELNSSKKEDYYIKIMIFSIIFKNKIKFVYNLTTLQETSQIEGLKKDFFINRHLSLIKNVTQGNYLIKNDKNYILFENQDPFIQLKKWEQEKELLILYAKLYLEKNDITEDKKLLFNELIIQKGDYIKALIFALNKKTNFLNAQIREPFKSINKPTMSKVLSSLDNKIKDTKYSINQNANKIEKSENINNSNNILSLDKIMDLYGGKDIYSRNMTINLICEYLGYKAVPLSKLLKNPSSPINDSSIFAYVMDIIDIFVSNDKKLIDKLREYSKNCIVLNLDEFISYMEKINFKINEKNTINFLDFYNENANSFKKLLFTRA